MGATLGQLHRCRSTNTARNGTSPGRRSLLRPARLNAAGRSRTRPVRRPAASGNPPALRLPPRDRRRPRVVGGAQGPDPRPRRASDGRPRRGPPDRVLRLRGRHSSSPVRRRRRHRLGLGNVGRRGADPRRHRRRGCRRTEVPARRREAQGTLHHRPDERPATQRGRSGRPRVRGRRRRPVAPDPQARRGGRPGLGCRGSPPERQDRADQRRCQGRPRCALERAGPRGGRRDRPGRRHGRGHAVQHRADARDAGVEAVQRPRLALRDQVGRVPDPGGRRRRARPVADQESQGRRRLLPVVRRHADLDRGARGHRGRRGGGARRRRPPGLRSPPGASRRCVGEGARLPGVRPALPRRALAPPGPARGSQAPAPERAPRASPRPLRRPRARRGRGVLRGGAGTGARGDHRQAPTLQVRARPPVDGVAQDQGPSRAGARRRGLDAGRGQREGPRGRGGWRVRRRTTPVQRQGRLRVRRPDATADPRATGRPRDRDAAVRPGPAARLPRTMGRRAQERPLGQARARDPGRARWLVTGRHGPPGRLQGDRGGPRSEDRDPRAGRDDGRGRQERRGVNPGRGAEAGTDAGARVGGTAAPGRTARVPGGGPRDDAIRIPNVGGGAPVGSDRGRARGPAGPRQGGRLVDRRPRVEADEPRQGDLRRRSAGHG